MEGGSKAMCGLAILAASMLWAQANVDENPYTTIVTRNPFGLKDPPPPPPPPQENVPTTPPAKVTLTGLISMFGQPQALFEIIDEPGKGGGTPKKPILREGERMGPVEVLQIDVTKNTVKIRNSGQETNLTFEIAKAPGPGGPGVPGIPVPPPAMPGSVSPNIPGPGGQATVPVNANQQGSSGITLVGGGTPALTPPGTPTATPSVNTGIDPNTGLRTIPNRSLRGAESMSREQIEALHNAAQQKGTPPGLQQSPNQAPAPPLPTFPRPGGPLPGAPSR